MYLINFDGTEELQGFLYFSLSLQDNSSSYIGTLIERKFRGQGISKLLVSIWIKYCLENDIEALKTSIRQRKPFLLYVLKGFCFEIRDLNKYNGRSIHICKKSPYDGHKYLVFDNLQDRKIFEEGKRFAQDDYRILASLSGTVELDKVRLNTTYYLEPFLNEDAYAYAKAIISRRGK